MARENLTVRHSSIPDSCWSGAAFAIFLTVSPAVAASSWTQNLLLTIYMTDTISDSSEYSIICANLKTVLPKLLNSSSTIT